jgi:hypothetical protein
VTQLGLLVSSLSGRDNWVVVGKSEAVAPATRRDDNKTHENPLGETPEDAGACSMFWFWQTPNCENSTRANPKEMIMRTRYLTPLHLVVVFVFASPAFAVVTGGKDAPIKDRGFPNGSLPLANLKTRIAWWEGPPFGGGQYHFEYSGRTADLQRAIDLFAKVDSKRKQVVVSEGVQTSFWLDIQDKEKKHAIDWQFVVWVPKNWQHLSNARAGHLPPGEEGDSPMTVLNIFVTDRIKWKSLRIPKSLRVVDERLEANGIAADQGAALREASSMWRGIRLKVPR